MPKFEDFYRILQVHQNAEQEVIESAFRRLCKKYHPDVNHDPEAVFVMQRLNEAYNTLKDPARRSAYHREWTARSGAMAPRVAPSVQQAGTLQALSVIRSYFKAISSGNICNAYDIISEQDKSSISESSFCEWQESVAELYHIGNFSIKIFKIHQNFRTFNSATYRAEEYAVTVAEKNKRTGEVREYSLTKSAILENGVWRVYLGYRDLTPIVKQFRFIVDTSGNHKVSEEWNRYIKTNDPVTGLPNREGFSDLLAPEIYKYTRYRRPFCVAVLKVKLFDKGFDPRRYENITKYIGYIIKNSLRLVDSAAYIGPDRFALVFSETEKKECPGALRRILSAVMRDTASCFDIDLEVETGYAPYSGESANELIGKCEDMMYRRGRINYAQLRSLR